MTTLPEDMERNPDVEHVLGKKPRPTTALESSWYTTMSSAVMPPERLESPERNTCDVAAEVQKVTVAVVMNPTVPVVMVAALNADRTDGEQVGGH